MASLQCTSIAGMHDRGQSSNGRTDTTDYPENGATYLCSMLA